MSVFRLTTAADDRLPRLAWCAEVDLPGRSAVVTHGPWVETGPGFAVEGAWGDDFAAAGFADALVFTGTGVAAERDGLRFVTPTHTLQPLLTLRRATKLYCSNSLVFLLTASGTPLQESYRFYYDDFVTVIDGLRQYIRRVPLQGAHAEIHYHCNLWLHPDGRLERQAKQEPPGFRDFDDYRAFLQDQVSRVTVNARDHRRRVTYEPLTTISSGYDSPTCAVLARTAGCRRAITFTTAREDFAEREDSGRAVAEHLGLDVTELDPDGYRSRSDVPEIEIEFIATGTPGGDVVFAAAEAHLERALLFTGFQGDKIWDRYTDHGGPDIVRADPSGGSLSEFRLRVGFLNFPVPFAGCVRHADIHAISSAPDMRPWALGGTEYDRPIPRRIVESAGVSRERFGRHKKAIAIPYQRASRASPPLPTVLSPAGYADFRRATAGMALFPGRAEQARFALMRALWRLDDRLLQSRKLARLSRLLRLPVRREAWMARRFSKPRTEHVLVFHWAVGRLRSRYAVGAQATSNRHLDRGV